MKNILNNNYNKELIIYALTEPDIGHVALNGSIIKKCIEQGKKVLFYSLEQPKDIMLKRIGLNDNPNLLIIDKLLTNIEDMNNTIDGFKPDLVIIDYFFLLTHDTKIEDIYVINRIAKEHNIPFIVVLHLGCSITKNLDSKNATIEKLKEVDPKLLPIIETSDRFLLFYIKSKENKEYMLKELKNIYGEAKEYDIRELLQEN